MATISKTSTFEVPKFSQNFSPLPFRWVLPAGFGALGPQLPRLDTAALGSLERPCFHRRAAHRGQGSGGCAGQIRPWPRDEGFGGENLLEAMGSLREEVDEMLNVSLSVENVLPRHLALLFCVVLCDPDYTVPTP